MNLILYAIGWIGSVITTALITKRFASHRSQESDLMEQTSQMIRERIKNG